VRQLSARASQAAGQVTCAGLPSPELLVMAPQAARHLQAETRTERTNGSVRGVRVMSRSLL
jgi:hypothetical protein